MLVRDENISGVQYEGDMELRILDQASWVGRDDAQRQGQCSSVSNHADVPARKALPPFSELFHVRSMRLQILPSIKEK
jgi:hypothetical protein